MRCFRLLVVRVTPVVLLIAGTLLPYGSCFAEQQPLKVFVLVGQSNMQGHAKIKTFEHIGMDPKTAPLLREMQNSDGTPRVFQNIWISYLSSKGVKHGALSAGFGADESKIGPELTFGITLQKQLSEPILIIKAAWGGKSLNTDFRPPGAGPYKFSDSQLERFKKQGKDLKVIQTEKVKATGHYYRLTLAHVKSVLADIKKVYPDYDPAKGYKLSGLVWFQGWNDMVDSGTYSNRGSAGGYGAYSSVMGHLIRDIRKDLAVPKLPIVIGVLGVGGPVDKYGANQQRYKTTHQNFRNAMAAPASLPEFRGNVAAVLTENFWDMELNALVARDGKVNREVKKIQKEQKLNGKQAGALKKKLRDQEFSKRELAILEKGVSNAAFHYLGSGKIMALIGKGFADAMVDLQPK